MGGVRHPVGKPCGSEAAGEVIAQRAGGRERRQVGRRAEAVPCRPARRRSPPPPERRPGARARHRAPGAGPGPPRRGDGPAFAPGPALPRRTGRSHARAGKECGGPSGGALHHLRAQAAPGEPADDERRQRRSAGQVGPQKGARGADLGVLGQRQQQPRGHAEHAGPALLPRRGSHLPNQRLALGISRHRDAANAPASGRRALRRHGRKPLLEGTGICRRCQPCAARPVPADIDQQRRATVLRRGRRRRPPRTRTAPRASATAVTRIEPPSRSRLPHRGGRGDLEPAGHGARAETAAAGRPSPFRRAPRHGPAPAPSPAARHAPRAPPHARRRPRVSPPRRRRRPGSASSRRAAVAERRPRPGAGAAERRPPRSSPDRPHPDGAVQSSRLLLQPRPRPLRRSPARAAAPAATQREPTRPRPLRPWRRGAAPQAAPAAPPQKRCGRPPPPAPPPARPPRPTRRRARSPRPAPRQAGQGSGTG